MPVARDQRLPLVEADGDDHDAPAVAGREVAPERAVHVVAERRPVLVHDLRLREEAEVGDHGERDVGQRQLHQLSLAGGATVAFGGEHRRSPR